MNGFEVTPEMMESIAKEFGSKIEEWNSTVESIKSSYDALKPTFEGDARAVFDSKMEENMKNYSTLSNTLNEYRDAIIKASADYRQADEEAATVFKTN